LKHIKEKELAKLQLAKEEKRKLREKKEAKPRKSKSSFNYFFKDKFEAARKEAGDKSSVGDVTKIIGQKWAASTPAEKKKYEVQSEKDKDRYQKEMKAYKLTLPPKRSLSSFMVFSKKESQKLREDQPQHSVAVIAKLLGQKWGALSAEQKVPFETEAKKLKDQYVEKLSKFNATHKE